ncbi:unnamed protein product [Hyaloperonospora brassicae]|uniref:RxLR effector candidate protein n=1 Tax=Hyaloperonospora brassicae TaxID=162125 RepID=A0AAV0UCH5_HYABA|nr:unnamed protein product [Hyaloperonospora brassicae]
MKFSSGLVLAAVAVTAAHAGNSNSLRTTEETPSEHDHQSSGVAHDHVNVQKIEPEDLEVDLEQIFGISKDGSPTKFNIMDVIGSGDGQADLEDVVELIKSVGSDSDDLSWLDDFDKTSGSEKESVVQSEYEDNSYDDKAGKPSKGDDMSWLNDFDDSTANAAADKSATKGATVYDDADTDSTGVKGGDDEVEDDDEPEVDVNGAKSATKGDAKGEKGDASGSDDLAWLFDDDAGSKMFGGVKGDNKNPAPFVVGGDSTGVKGGDAEVEDDDEPEVDGNGAKSATKGDAKGEKGDASGSDDLAWLFDDDAGSKMFGGVKGDNKNPAPFVVGGDSTGVKGGDDVVEDDDESEVDVNGAKSATKGDAKGEKGDASGSDDLAWLFDDDAGSKMFGGMKGDNKNPAPFVVGGDSTGVKGGDAEVEDDDDDDLAWLFDDDAGSKMFGGVKGDNKNPAPFVVGGDSTGVKGGDKEPFVAGEDDDSEVDDAVASKASKASKKGGDDITFANLYDEGSNGLVGVEDPVDDKYPTAVAGATKGEAPSTEVDDDKESFANEATQDDVVQSDENVKDDKSATKGTK